jgi:hypothetical protein
MPTHSELEALLGQHISQICPHGYANNADNHCAHFVSHVLGYDFGTTCGDMVKGRGAAASIRVHEIFGQCRSVGEWSTAPSQLFWGLVFITNAAGVNLTHKRMTNVPRKHVGIFLGIGRTIWHYSNAQQKVVRQSPQLFAHHYPAPFNSLFWGDPP